MPGDFEFQWGQLVARAWADPAFKAKLLADPAGVLKENGVTPPAGAQLKVVADDDKVVHLVLPAKPTAQELSEEELHRVAAGKGHESCFRCGENCYRCHEACRRCSDEACYRCERC